MRKLTLLVALLLAASVSVADAQSSKAKKAEPADPNANSKKFLVDALPLMMPSAVMYYMLYQKQAEREKQEKAVAMKASGRKKKAAQ